MRKLVPYSGFQNPSSKLEMAEVKHQGLDRHIPGAQMYLMLQPAYMCQLANLVAIDGETVETMSDFIFWAPKSLQMVTAAMKLKDTCSLEEKL